MQARQIGLDVAHGQAQRCPQPGDQGHDAHTDAPMPDDAPLEIKFGFDPLGALGAVALKDLVLDDLQGRGRGQIEDFTAASDAVAGEMIGTGGTGVEGQGAHLRGGGAGTTMIVPRVAFLAGAARGGVGAGFIGFDEGGRGLWRGQGGQLGLEGGDERVQVGEVGFQASHVGLAGGLVRAELRILSAQQDDLFFQCHGRHSSTFHCVLCDREQLQVAQFPGQPAPPPQAGANPANPSDTEAPKAMPSFRDIGMPGEPASNLPRTALQVLGPGTIRDRFQNKTLNIGGIPVTFPAAIPDAELSTFVWQPCNESLSPFVPFYRISVPDPSQFVYIRANDGQPFVTLTSANTAPPMPITKLAGSKDLSGAEGAGPDPQKPADPTKDTEGYTLLSFQDESEIVQDIEAVAEAAGPQFNPRDAVVFTGFNAASPIPLRKNQGYSRLYLTLQMNEYVEFLDTDVLTYRALQKDNPELGLIVWLRKGATVEFGRIQVTELQQTFTQGDLMGQQWVLPSSGSGGAPQAPASIACGGGSWACGGGSWACGGGSWACGGGSWACGGGLGGSMRCGG